MMASFLDMMGFWPEMMVLQLPSVGCYHTLTYEDASLLLPVCY